MRSNELRLDYILVFVLALVMIIVLLVSGLFYFNLLSGGSFFDARVVYSSSQQHTSDNGLIENSSTNITTIPHVEVNSSGK